jgi:plasmid stability protein
MFSLIQIRNVPADLHRKAKARAALAGMTLSDYALRALERQVSEPTLAEVAARVHLLEPVDSPLTAAAVVRAERDAR